MAAWHLGTRSHFRVIGDAGECQTNHVDDEPSGQGVGHKFREVKKFRVAEIVKNFDFSRQNCYRRNSWRIPRRLNLAAAAFPAAVNL